MAMSVLSVLLLLMLVASSAAINETSSSKEAMDTRYTDIKGRLAVDKELIIALMIF